MANLRYYGVIGLIAIFFGLACTAKADPVVWFIQCFDGEATRIASGFEGGGQVIESADERGARIASPPDVNPCQSVRRSSGDPISPQLPPAEGPSFGPGVIYFEAGGKAKRGAELLGVSGPTGNKVLRFWLREPNVVARGPGFPGKGRVQMDLYGNRGIRVVHMSVRMYLHQDFRILEGFSGIIDWLTISEWWNNASWTGDRYPFRIKVDLVKPNRGAGDKLRFRAQAEAMDPATKHWNWKVWSVTNAQVEVPVGRWVKLDYEYVEGDEQTGRFSLAIQPDGEARIVVLDVRGATRHPADTSPKGLAHLNPLKLYTSDRVVNFVSERGGRLAIDWDDLEITGRR